MGKSFFFILLFLTSLGSWAQSQETRCDCDAFSTSENIKDLQAVADFTLGPTNLPPFVLDKENEKAVFIDITRSTYNLEIFNDPKEVLVTAVVNFKMLQPGHPLFDLIPNAESVEVDGRPAELGETKLPCDSSKMRYVKTALKKGNHRMVLKYKLAYPFLDAKGRRIDDKAEEQDMYMKLSDLNDRGYLERYLPTNLTSDQYPFEVNVKFRQERGDFFVLSNGDVREKRSGNIRINFPKESNASSMLLHLAHRSDYDVQESTYESVQSNGKLKSIPLIVYTAKSEMNSNVPAPTEFMDQAKLSLKKAEQLFGPVIGNRFVIKAKPHQSGGMEYAMAAETGLEAMDHEILHSYFGRGIQSKDGNSQWLDEGVAVWLEEFVKGERNISGNDKNLPLTQAGAPFLISANLGARSAYHRNSERSAYRYGANFMSFLDWKISQSDPKKGLITVLQRLVKERMNKSWDANIFLKAFKDETGLDLSDGFDFFVKGRNLDQLKDANALVKDIQDFEAAMPHQRLEKVSNGKTSLIHLAASGNSVETFNAIHARNPAELSKVDTYGRSVLAYAIAGKNPAMVRRVIELGYSPDPVAIKILINNFPQMELAVKRSLCETLNYKWDDKYCD